MTIFTRINKIQKYIKVLMVSRIQILASVDGNKVFLTYFTFVLTFSGNDACIYSFNDNLFSD